MTAESDAVPREHVVPATPVMGWNSWNSFGQDINERVVQEIADALVASGLRDVGYRYVVIDDCWFHPERTSEGQLQEDRQRFPTGISALADYLHTRNLRFGLYQSPSDMTCAQRNGTYPGATGSRGYEDLDAHQFASWGVDYLKYDWCSPQATLQQQITAFRKMRDALRATGRPIVYSINPNSNRDHGTGAAYDWSTIAHLWRTTANLTPTWNARGRDGMGVVNVLDINAELADNVHPGHFNDPDVLQVGVAGHGESPGLTNTESRAHFGLWSLTAAPLMLGNDVRHMHPAARKIVTNREVIAVNQDTRATQARRVSAHDGKEVWNKELADGSRAVGLLNRNDTTARIRAHPRLLGLPPADSYHVRDLGEHTDHHTTTEIRATVPAHGLAMFAVTPIPRAHQLGQVPSRKRSSDHGGCT